MLQDKQAEEEEEGRRGNRPGQIGRKRGDMTTTRGSPVGHRKMVPPPSRDGSAAVEARVRSVRAACEQRGRGVGADAACSEAWSRGAAPTNQPPSF